MEQEKKTSVNPKSPFVVKVDPLIQPLIPDYLRNRGRDLERLVEALARKDFAVLRKIGHDMHGSGAGYGLPPISEIGARIEEGANAKDLERVRAATDDLKLFLETVKLPP